MIVLRCLQILCHASGYEALPMFHNLSYLRFFGCIYFEWHAIRFLLGRTPKLQKLVFKSCLDYSYGKLTPNDSWKETLDVPESLSLLIPYFVHPRFACRTQKNPKILFSLCGALRISKMTWHNLFRHRKTQNAPFSSNEQIAPSQP